jgi:hypothetical protein
MNNKFIFSLLIFCFSASNVDGQNCEEIKVLSVKFKDTLNTVFIEDWGKEKIKDTTRLDAARLFDAEYNSCLIGKRKFKIKRVFGKGEKEKQNKLGGGKESDLNWSYIVSGWKSNGTIDYKHADELILYFRKRKLVYIEIISFG